MRLPLLLPLTALAFLTLTATALGADVPPPQHPLALPAVQVYTLLIGALVPLITYIINHAAPWVSEPVKAAVLVVAAAIAGALYQVLEAGEIGWNARTLEVVGTAIVGALAAHHWLWQPSGTAARLGAGSNR